MAVRVNQLVPLLRSACREVPEVPLRVTSRILPLAIRLVCRWRVDGSSGTFSMIVVSIYIVDEDDESAWLCWQRPGRDQAVFGVDAMDPDY
jgi:hypothetical protein